MKLIDHIKRCNAFDPALYRPFTIAGHPVGTVAHPLAARLAAFPDIFTVTDRAVHFADRLATPEARGAAMDGVLERLREDGSVPRARGERYRVVTRWGEEPLMLIDRAAAPVFGLKAFGVHLNGYVKDKGTIRLWIGQRAADREVEPEKLDNMVAGGQPAGLGLMDNLLKEAAEEAAVPRHLVLRAAPAGALGYCMAGEWGLKPDTLFVYDLELPRAFTPTNTDGEISGFFLMEPGEILDILKSGHRFKFNVPLVLIDFFIRHGLLSPDDEPDYIDLVRGLREGL